MSSVSFSRLLLKRLSDEAVLRERLLLNVLHDETLPSCPSVNSFHYGDPQKGGDKWGIVEINTAPVLQGATEKNNKITETIGEMAAALMCFWVWRRFLCFRLLKLCGP